MPKVSILIPTHDMENGAFFLWRNINSILSQSFKDYEIVITKEPGTAAHNINQGIKKCRGEIVKILLLDDYFAHKDALRVVVESFGLKYNWLVTGCDHDNEDGNRFNKHLPKYADNLYTGNNTIGAPSVLAFKREGALFFDETLVWLVDCDLYTRYHDAYGLPRLVNDINVTIGIGGHQMTNKISDYTKDKERAFMVNKYG